ncbi:MAG: DUF1194 domain-containing protein [Pseudomonadota bacterium]
MRFWFAFALAFGLIAPADADDLRVDVELVLAVDVSRSMSERELEIQRRGYAEALASPEVVMAIEQGYYGKIALTYLEWAGTFSQREIVGWTLIENGDDARGFAAKLTAEFNTALRRTSISGVLDHASALFIDNGFNGTNHVIDISGDGPNNMGRPVDKARDDALARGVTINGLPLMTREGLGAQWHLDDLDRYYEDCVIGGAQAFVIPVLEWEHFPAAVRRKLVLEIAGRTPQVVPARLLVDNREKYDCLIGEKIWREMMDTWDW